jgi:hypothetical protein
MVSEIISIGKTPIFHFEFPYEKIDPLPFQLLIRPRHCSKRTGLPARSSIKFEMHEIHVAA